MRFKLGYVSGFATGYYLGAKAGRPRYEQIQRGLRKVRASQPVAGAVDSLAGRAREAAAKATTALPHRHSNGSAGHADSRSDTGPNTIPAAAALTGQPGFAPEPAGGYSSSR